MAVCPGKAVWLILQKLKTELPYDLGIQLPYILCAWKSLGRNSSTQHWNVQGSRLRKGRHLRNVLSDGAEELAWQLPAFAVL